ncbi:LysM peptidoglycan-binding domain-containing protein [Alicyclobacillus acidocaldarius]|uniref:LysM peptidoglycan-binding domain-containing protein n=1 Tax=Alicyclobacillus acidocaldarius TaxID=405212 RepID=UPI001FE04CAE|nr:LysM peptidoglycan-binding domain-containing protein [Alicyclobacillus acidocaldarius]
MTVVKYIVQPGDTLGNIAVKYDTTVSAIVRANGIKNPNMIYPGQVLKIPSKHYEDVKSSAYHHGMHHDMHAHHKSWY